MHIKVYVLWCQKLISDIENEILEIRSFWRMLEVVQNQIQVQNFTPNYAFVYKIVGFKKSKVHF